MGDHSPGKKASLNFADEAFGGNPFSEDDPRRHSWETMARYATEEMARFHAELLTRPTETSAEHVSWIIDGQAGRYDILAKSILSLTVSKPESILPYIQLLKRLVEAMIARTARYCPSFVHRATFVSELSLRLNQRQAHWTAEAFKIVRTFEVGTKRSVEHLDPATSGKDVNRAVQSRKRSDGGHGGKGGDQAERVWMTIPTLTELRRQKSISQKTAADYLRCHVRTIGNYLRNKKLRRAPSGRVICDDSLFRLLRQKHGDRILTP